MKNYYKKNGLYYFVIISILFFNLSFAQSNIVLDWATYYFGRNSTIKDIEIDNNGDVIVAGNIEGKANVPYNLAEPFNYYSSFTTPNAHQQNIGTNFGKVFIAKFSSTGSLVWATYFGGENCDYITELEIDENNIIFISGTTRSTTGIATNGAYITDFNLISSIQNPKTIGFLAKFSNSGQLNWCTYTPECRMFLKNSNEIYLVGETKLDNNISTTNAYNPDFYIYDNNSVSNNRNGFIMKFDGSGNKIAGTYCGPTANIKDLSTDSSGNVYIVGSVMDVSNSLSYNFTTPNAFQTSFISNPNNIINRHGIISKFTSDLSTRIWSTFYGGDLDDNIDKIIVYNNNLYIDGSWFSSNMNTLGTYIPGQIRLLSKFNTDGFRVWSTYINLNLTGKQGFLLSQIKNDKIYIVGRTDVPNFYSTPNAYQVNINNTANPNTTDGLILQYNLDGTKNWGTYFGGQENDNIYDLAVINDNEFYIGGSTSSPTNIATPNSLQPNLDLGTGTTANNMFLAKFSPNVLSTTSNQKTNLALYPNPSNGNFSLQGNVNISENLNLAIYDNLGREIATQQVENHNTKINTNINLQKMLKQGVYFAKLETENQVIQTFKIVIK